MADKEILDIAQKAVWKKNPREWHYALFDYGATILKDKTINKRSRHYHKQSKFEGSFRSYRTKVVKLLLAQPNNKIPIAALDKFLQKMLEGNKAPYLSQEIINTLIKDKLIKKSQKYYSL